MKRTVFLVAIALACILAERATCQTIRPESFRSTAERLQLSVDFKKEILTGTIDLDLENWTKQPSATVSFILHRLMQASSVTGSAGAPLDFSQDVLRFVDEPKRQVTQIQVKLAKPVPAGGKTRLRIAYSGYLAPYSEIGWLYVQDHIDTAFTILRRDALAFPEIGGLSDAANRKLPFPAFTYSAEIRVPSGFLVAAGGRSTVSLNSDGTVTWRYESGNTSPFINISIARFDTLNAGPVRIFYFPSDSIGARHLASSATAALDTLSAWFGPLRSNPLLTIAEIPDGWGSQANAVGGIIQTASAFRDTMQVGQLYHELTHLWNALDHDTPSPRWNEGLASFLEDLLREKLNHWAMRRERENQRLSSLKQLIVADSSLRRVPFIEYGSHNMTGRSYSVGRLMFSTLYDLVGPAEFQKIIGGYQQQFARGGSARELIAFARKTSARDLKSFFDDWMLTTRWTSIAAGADSVADIAARYR